jgi:protein-S-isoprenylcysteine O-methyltransferase Ste14
MAVLHWLAPLWGPVGLPWRLLGLVPLAGGLALAIRAEQFFKRAGTTVKPFERSSRLVTDGPFGFSRHPMYLGMTLALAGVALLLGTATPPVGVVLFAAVISLRFIPAEERAMERTFGEEYRRYRSRVRRWL